MATEAQRSRQYHDSVVTIYGLNVRRLRQGLQVMEEDDQVR
jgi:hypothetical protein